MAAAAALRSPRTAREYDQFLKTLYMRVPRRVVEIMVPRVRMISVSGNDPPASKSYQDAIGVLFTIAYTLKMGFLFRKLARPKGYFDYKVGALETLWWSSGWKLDIVNPRTLRWQAYLMVPQFVTKRLFSAARKQAASRCPELPMDRAELATFSEGRAVQMLHVGPYKDEGPDIALLKAYAADQKLVVSGRHHEIYISDPRRTKPEKLRTVIRLGVTRARAGK